MSRPPRWPNSHRASDRSNGQRGEFAASHVPHFRAYSATAGWISQVRTSCNSRTKLPAGWPARSFINRTICNISICPRCFRAQNYAAARRSTSRCVALRPASSSARRGSDDLVTAFGLARDRVTVIPLAPLAPIRPTPTPPLPANYLYYPAAPWPHKNHARLVAAFASFAATRPDANLVLTGARVESSVDVMAVAEAIILAHRVHALGYLSEGALAGVYAHARAVVVPTLFESASFPIWEAFQRGVPVACSTVTALPRQVGDAALLFIRSI